MYSSFYIGKRRRIIATSTSSGNNVNIDPVRVLNEHNFIFVLDGEVNITTEFFTCKLKKDDMLIIHAGHRHYSTQPCSPDTCILYIHAEAFEEDVFSENQPSFDQADSYITLKSVFHCVNRLLIKSIINTMIEIRFFIREDRPFKIFGVSAYFDTLLYELRCEQDKLAVENDIISKAICIIVSTPKKFYTLKEMSDILGISGKTLEKKFKEKTGYTFHKYQVYKKIEKISLLIRFDSQVPLKSIAAQYGFYDEFHLSKAFKSATGMSPSEFKSFFKAL